MKVTEVRVYYMGSGVRGGSTIVQVLTDEGISGVGECTIGEWGETLGGAVQRMAQKFIIGQDPRRIEKLWDDMYRASFWGRGGGPILTAAISGIEEACWDILGKSLNVPVYALLGGKMHERLRLYANGWSNNARGKGDVSLYARMVERVVNDGFTALKFDPFQEQFSNHDSGIPPKILDRAHIRRVVERVKTVRQAVGPDMDIIIEVHGWLNASSAVEVARHLAEYDIYYYEEPVDPTNVELMRRVREECGLKVATGERLYTKWGFREVIEKQAADLLQPDINITGGIWETKKIAAMADAYHIPIQPHNCWGPIATAAAVQFDACTSNFLIQEWFPYKGAASNSIVLNPPEDEAKGGYYAVPDRPGLGVDLNEAAVKDHLLFTAKAE